MKVLIAFFIFSTVMYVTAVPIDEEAYANEIVEVVETSPAGEILPEEEAPSFSGKIFDFVGPWTPCFMSCLFDDCRRGACYGFENYECDCCHCFGYERIS